MRPQCNKEKLTLNAAVKVAELPLREQAALLSDGLQDLGKAAAKQRKHHVTQNSGCNEWYTPPRIIELARSAMGDIDLDPASCATANIIVGATRYFTAVENGLNQEWSGKVWLNPPYSQGLMAPFAEATATKFESGEFEQACILVNNATETEWFHRLMDVASAVWSRVSAASRPDRCASSSSAHTRKRSHSAWKNASSSVAVQC